MNYLHYTLNLNDNDVVEVVLDKAANVRLLDSSNFSNYHNGKEHRYYGGYVTVSPYRLATPNPGQWHLVIDLGGYAGTVKASVSVKRGSQNA